MLKNVLYLILVSFFLYMIYLFFQSYAVFIVSTSSMAPAISKASLVLVDKREEAFDLGDVVTYRYKNQSLVTHRITKVDNSFDNLYFTTKGDANDYSDTAKVTQENIVGRVVFTFPYLGYLVLCLVHPVFLFFFFYIPIGHYFGVSSKRFVNQISN